MYLRRKDGHSAWLSTAALKLAGIESGTADPAGGVIDRDARGAATGIVRETAMHAVEAALPRPADEDFDAAMRRALGHSLHRPFLS